jgi:hypothetical protein
MILIDSTSRNPVDLNWVSMEARQLTNFNLFTDQENFNSGACEQGDWNVGECLLAWSAVLEEGSVAQGSISQACSFEESFLIPPCKSVWKYVGSE